VRGLPAVRHFRAHITLTLRFGLRAAPGKFCIRRAQAMRFRPFSGSQVERILLPYQNAFFDAHDLRFMRRP
jgi:hypothetical protein